MISSTMSVCFFMFLFIVCATCMNGGDQLGRETESNEDFGGVGLWAVDEGLLVSIFSGIGLISEADLKLEPSTEPRYRNRTTLGSQLRVEQYEEFLSGAFGGVLQLNGSEREPEHLNTNTVALPDQVCVSKELLRRHAMSLGNGYLRCRQTGQGSNGDLEQNDIKKITIFERRPDETFVVKAAFDLVSSGFSSFSQQIAACHPLRSMIALDFLPFALSPWPRYTFSYMKVEHGQYRAMDPLSTKWTHFREHLDHVVVEAIETNDDVVVTLETTAGGSPHETRRSSIRKALVPDRATFEKALTFIVFAVKEEELSLMTLRQDFTNFMHAEDVLTFVNADGNRISPGQDEDFTTFLEELHLVKIETDVLV